MLLIKMICGCVFDATTGKFRELCSEDNRNTALKKLGVAHPINNDPFALQWMSPPREVCGFHNHFHCEHVYNNEGIYVGEKEYVDDDFKLDVTGENASERVKWGNTGNDGIAFLIIFLFLVIYGLIIL